MKNKTLKLLIPVFLIFSLSSCLRGNNGESNSGEPNEPSSSLASSTYHSHKWVVDDENSIPATCVSEGKRVSRCTVCGETKEVKISKTAHSYIEVEGGIPATCTESGETKYQCLVCADTKFEVAEALGHEMVFSGTIKEPAIEENGIDLYICSRCGFEKEVLTYNAEHEHDFIEGNKSDISALREISCTSCSYRGYELWAEDLTEGQKEPVPGDKSTRLGKNIFDDVWNISGIEQGKYNLYFNSQASPSNASKGYWNSATAVERGDTVANNGGEDAYQLYKYTAQIDENDPINVGNDEDNYADTGLTDNSINWTTKSLCTLDIPNNASTLTIHNNNNGYSIWVFKVRLIKIA